jgi:CHAT domain-containing protein
VVRARLPGRRLVHLATHGFFLGGERSADGFATYGPLARLDSGVVLAGANRASAGDSDDQVLDAEEVGMLDLSGTELVVLSACDSALGYVSAGQGLIGLLGAFDRARAPAVLSALWQVGDVDTATLISAFYRHAKSTDGPRGPSLALRMAQSELSRSAAKSAAGTPLSHPRFWAAFVLTGDPFLRPSAPSR